MRASQAFAKLLPSGARALAVAVAVIVAAVLTVWLLVLWSFAHPPITARLLELKRLEMVDEAGQPLSLCVLNITNGAAEYFELPRKVERIEGRVGGRWMDLRDIDTLWWLRPNSSFEFITLVPAGADACRINLQYQPARLWWRVWVWVGKKIPRFADWAWAPQSPVRPLLVKLQGKNEQFSRPERWWHTTLQVTFSRGESAGKSR